MKDYPTARQVRQNPVPHSLQYAKSGRSWRRAGLRAAFVALLILVGWISWSAAAPDIEDRLRVFDLQRSAIDHAPTQDTEVFAWTFWPRHEYSIGYQTSRYSQRQWSTFLTDLGADGDQAVYLGAHRSPSGPLRLVAILARGEMRIPSGTVTLTDSDHSAILFHAIILEPATRLRRPTILHADDSIKVLVPWRDKTQVFAGQPNASDFSHFTIGIATSDVSDQIDGWLQDDDTVRLVPRKMQTQAAK